MHTRYLYLLRLSLFVTDILLVNVAFCAAFMLLVNRQIEAVTTLGFYKNHLFIANLLWIFCSGVFGLYREAVIEKITRIYRASWRTVFFHGFMFTLYLIFSKYADTSRLFIAFFYFFIVAGVLISRFISTVIESIVLTRFSVARPVVVIGRNTTGLRLAAILQSSQTYKFEGFLDPEEGQVVDHQGHLIPSICQEIEKASNRGVKDLFVSLTPDRIVDMKHLVTEAEKQCVRMRFVPDIVGSPASAFALSYMGDFPVLTHRREPLEESENEIKKRIFDILFSSLVIIFVMSWLVPIIGLLIKAESPGPIFFRQLRSGRNNQPFWCYKFRSMKVNKDSDSVQAKKNDMRITRIGSFLRKTSLDEFPQFFNVLVGDMSVVGPRPHMLKHTEQYRNIINKYMVRHFLKPGITGWAQINGLRGETEAPELMQRRVEHDIWYMESWSLMLDMKITFLTVYNIFKGEEKAR